MRKPLKVFLLTVTAILALPALTLATTSIANAVISTREIAEIRPYGQLVPVDGKQMNVVESGAGEQTIVLLPGLGTAAPGLDFQPLIAELDDAYRVITVEPFGTGLSNQTDAPRTTENIVREVHEALQHLEVDRYVLMGHSIAGIYALEYSATYADELVAFIGIDSSVPDQPGWDEPIPTEGLVELRDLGILRALSAISGDPTAGLPYDDETKKQMQRLTTRNSTAPTMLDEMTNAPSNFASVSGTTFTPTLPVLLFVVAEDSDVSGWLELHEQQASSVERGEVITLEGEHYLHHTKSPEIARDTARFLDSISAG
ncbi:alpha/beta hydrolase [Pseudoclavibacter sp. AY1F1]|uniref:alpha/beta fold hydrolase n=1 Tax=Pseudoclavibacter sp. AY1F1 TaxID=2080583 RepID=UPI000CE7B676|nr:alpha/beta hydrolase [Pseudoclavibacter sp. AY1F1]PPF43368.1 alpha/beta hydrolase [Pseudoclavibacter sp. AY1F1]